MKQLTEKEKVKVGILVAPWMATPLDPKALKAQRKDFEASIKRIDKILAIIAPPPKPKVEKPKQ